MKPAADSAALPGPRRFSGVNGRGLWALFRRDVMRFLRLGMESLGGPAASSLLFMAVFVLASGRKGEMPAAGFSPRKANMTFYVGDSFEGALALFTRLGKHKKSVACLYINKLDDVDLEVLREIITREYAEVSVKGEDDST